MHAAIQGQPADSTSALVLDLSFHLLRMHAFPSLWFPLSVLYVFCVCQCAVHVVLLEQLLQF